MNQKNAQVEKIKLKLPFVLSRYRIKKYKKQFHLEDIVVDISFAFLNLCNFFPNGDKRITEPV
jgi:hypothetical protein